MLQHGMNFRVAPDHSVILMSRRPGAPYNDRVTDNGSTLIYEGHDVARSRGVRDPKGYDQPRTTPSGRPTPNGKFESAALAFKAGQPPELVRVYEKIKDGIWTYNGVFELVDARQEQSGRRSVFKFRLILTNRDLGRQSISRPELPHNRLIPSAVKREVYQRDKGRCVICGSADNLHFDHDFPFSKGGTSMTAKNIRLLCARHNLAKRDKIE
jgi:hypothetical protein